MIPFSFDAPNRFFSRQVVISDRSSQPTFTFPRGHLHNQGNSFAALDAAVLPATCGSLAWFGEATTEGLLFRITDQYSISGVGGGTVVHLFNPSINRVNNAAALFMPTAAAFLDRNEVRGPGVGARLTDIDDYFVSVNCTDGGVDARARRRGVDGDRQARAARRSARRSRRCWAWAWGGEQPEGGLGPRRRVGPRASGFRLQAPGFRLQAPGSRLQASGFRLQASGFRSASERHRIPAAPSPEV